jgi:hypothetical protein
MYNENTINSNIHIDTYNNMYNEKSDNNNYINNTDILLERETDILPTNKCDKNNSINIYRYKFTKVFMDKLYEFSKIHQYDEREDFKEAWIQWEKDNEDDIHLECERLTKLSYQGNIIDKMYKSARYYFRKKTTEKKEAKQRRHYINLSSNILKQMDNHIQKIDLTFQPKTAFIDFCNNHQEILKETISQMYKEGIIDTLQIQEKIKKTYKNRYFVLKSK